MGEQNSVSALKWLEWAKQIQAIGQTGLTYAVDVYDRERYEALRALSVEILSEYSGVETERVRSLFAEETGYATPKTDVRGVVFQEGKILMVQEKSDGGWTIPGGWADIGLTPSEVAVKEVWEESGFEVRPVRLLAVLDKKRHPHPPSPFHIYKIFILCEITGGEALEGVETSGVRFVGEDEVSSLELSVQRNTESQLRAVFALVRDPGADVLFD